MLYLSTSNPWPSFILKQPKIHALSWTFFSYLFVLFFRWHSSVSLYDAALQLCTEDTKVNLVVDITRRLGNVKNELGVLYMNKAAALIDSGAEPSFEERELWKKSFANFDRGIRTFDIIEDRLVVVMQFRSVCSRLAKRNRGGGGGGSENSERKKGSITESSVIKPN